VRSSKQKNREERRESKVTGYRAWPNGLKTQASLGRELKSNQFSLHGGLAVKTIRALYYRAGGDCGLTIVLV
jgi:hypothetical protein